MGKIKVEKNQKVSSFFASTKPRTRSQKDETSKVRLTKDETPRVRLTKDETSKVRLIKDEISKENKPGKRASIIKPKKKTDTACRRRALFERVRAKGQKSMDEFIDPVKKKQKNMLSRTREIANSLAFIYISNNRTVMSVKEAATRIAESSKIPISEYEALEHFELITKIAPEWCQFSTNKNKNDLLTINTSIPSRDALEEGIKNFDES